MHHNTLFMVTVMGLATVMPGTEQYARAALPTTHQDVVQLPMTAGSIKKIQNKLDEKGFSPGHIDGLWGPDTAGALSRFQAANGLEASGRFDNLTLAALKSIDAGPTRPEVQQMDATSAAGVLGSTSSASTSTADFAGAAGRSKLVNPAGNSGVPGYAGNIASGSNNQAMRATNTNSLQPAHGANSFTESEAKRRIARQGFQQVSDMQQDDLGVWRGTATKDGQRVRVWLDYQGNMGHQ